MVIKSSLLILAALFAPLAIGQQPSPQPAQAQAQPAPCITTSVNPYPSGNNPTVKVPNKLQQYFDKQRQQLAAKTGIALPDPSTTIAGSANSKPTPCPPAAKAEAAVPVAHLPHDVVTTWLCNPVVMAADHTTSYVMPSDVTEASPIQLNAFEADFAKPDARAATLCSSLHKDPKTAKFWLAQ